MERPKDFTKWKLSHVRLKLDFHSFRSQIGLRFFNLLQKKTKENLGTIPVIAWDAFLILKDILDETKYKIQGLTNSTMP